MRAGVGSVIQSGTMRCIRRQVPEAPAEQETTMQYVYRCTRCGTGWLAKKVEPSGQGWAVHIFICNRCRYASQPGELLAMQEGEGTLLASVHAAIIPVARLTGPEVKALRMAEIFTLLGLLPDAPRSKAQQHTFACA